MANPIQIVVEIGPKGKKVVAVAPAWPGLARGAKTEEAALDRLRSYIPRYAAIAELAGMSTDFAASTDLDVIEHYPGTGSTDFWGISFAFSSIDQQTTSKEELTRELTLMQACWQFFDNVRSRVSAEMQRGPRGGGRAREQIVQHTFAAELDWAKKLGLRSPLEALLTDEGLNAHRTAYCDAIRAFHADGKLARTWPLRYLIRHTAFHTLDHAWEMEDKDLGTLFDALGGAETVLRLAHAWHKQVMADEIVAHAFSHGFHPQHSERLAAYWGEAWGGPQHYSEQYGDETSVVRIHSGNGVHEEMDRRAIDCFDRAMDDIKLSSAPLRSVLHDYFVWTTMHTMAAYPANADAVPADLPIRHWSWDGLLE